MSPGGISKVDVPVSPLDFDAKADRRDSSEAARLVGIKWGSVHCYPGSSWAVGSFTTGLYKEE